MAEYTFSPETLDGSTSTLEVRLGDTWSHVTSKVFRARSLARLHEKLVGTITISGMDDMEREAARAALLAQLKNPKKDCKRGLHLDRTEIYGHLEAIDEGTLVTGALLERKIHTAYYNRGSRPDVIGDATSLLELAPDMITSVAGNFAAAAQVSLEEMREQIKRGESTEGTQHQAVGISAERMSAAVIATAMAGFRDSPRILTYMGIGDVLEKQLSGVGV